MTKDKFCLTRPMESMQNSLPVSDLSKVSRPDISLTLAMTVDRRRSRGFDFEFSCVFKPVYSYGSTPI